MKRIFTLFVLLLVGLTSFGQNVTLSGYVKDSASGEAIIGATVYTADLSAGVSTNAYGFYSLQLKRGHQTIKCSCMGYNTVETELDMSKSLSYDFLISEDKNTLDAATVFSKSSREELALPQMGRQAVDGALIRKLPALMGETDIVRVIQMMPGVQSPSEGSTGFSVRGGGVDQNLIIMDGAPLYNSGHFLGFLSMFNGDAVKNADLYKGDFPARYGGRMSSVLDVSTVDGNINNFGGNASVGLITSKIFLEGPVAKGKAGFMLAARRTYLDALMPLFTDKLPPNTAMYFYDANAKLNWIVNDKNRLYLSAFTGTDVFGMGMEEFNLDELKFTLNNTTETLRWNHVFSPRLFSNITIYNSRYGNLSNCAMTDVSFEYEQLLREYGLKTSFTWYANASNTVEFGVNLAGYSIQPGQTRPLEGSIVQHVAMPLTYAVQPSAFLQNEQKLGPVTLRYGLRFSTFTTTGDTEQRIFDPVTHELSEIRHYGKGEAIRTSHGLEPRFSASWAATDDFSLKASYSRTYQYIQQAMVSISGSPVDTWFTASPNVEPQVSDQFSLGANKLFCDDALTLSAELFYKDNSNTMDFKDNPGLVIDDVDREGLLRFGKSHAYGTELMLKYDFARWSGWLAYTRSLAMYDIPEINGGKPYRSPLNHENAVNFVLTYDFSKQWNASAAWVYYSGAPTTFPVGKFKFGDTYASIYSGRNEDSMPDYHRLDLSVTYRTRARIAGRRWSGEWNLSLYDAYARHNAWSLAFGYNRETGETQCRKVYLFTIIPSLSYNIKF